MQVSLLKQIAPLELNPATGEPFLRLPAPHANIIITPPRPTDAPAIASVHSNPKIYRWLSSPPYPYTLDHARYWLDMVSKETDAVLDELKDASEQPDAPPKITDKCPVQSIREVLSDGSDIFIGDCSFARSRFEWILDEKEREKLQDENNRRPAGDRDIIWTIGGQSIQALSLVNVH
jgi:RimJ/RimL family protein N-acetyltransferase